MVNRASFILDQSSGNPFMFVFFFFSGLQTAVTNYSRFLEEIKIIFDSANASRYIV